MKDWNYQAGASLHVFVPEAYRYGERYAEKEKDGTIKNESELVSEIEDKWGDEIKDELEGLELPRRMPNMTFEMDRCKDAQCEFGEFEVSLSAETNCPVRTDSPDDLGGDFEAEIITSIENAAKRRGWKVSCLDVDVDITAA